MSLNEELIHFIIGSSLFITIYPFLYLQYAYNRMSEGEKEESVVSLSTLFFILPIMFGVIFALTYRLISFVPRKYNMTYVRFIIAGTLTSLVVSLICHYGFHIQDKWLRLPNPEMSHVVVPGFYFVLFYTVGIWLRAQILYGPQPTTSNSSSPISLPSRHSPSVGVRQLNTQKSMMYEQMAKKSKQ